jgi:hypothetical protein
MKLPIIIFAALLLGGCAANDLRSIVPIIPQKPTYTEGPKLYV